MKKLSTTKRMLVSLCTLFLVLVLTTSCKNRVDDLLDAIPADSDIVIVGDLNTIVESAGGSIEGSKINLPSEISDLIEEEARDIDEMISSLKNSGINVQTCALTGNFNDEILIVIFKLDDKDKFIKYLESEDFDEDSDENGITIYEYSGEYSNTYFAIKGSFAYWLPEVYGESDFKAKRYISDFIDEANSKSFLSTGMGEYIKEGNIGGVSIKLPSELRHELAQENVPSEVADMFRGYVCMRGSLNENNAHITMKLFDNEGKLRTVEDFDGIVDLEASINPDALQYMSKDEFLIYAVSVKDFDWKEFDKVLNATNPYSDEYAALILIKSYLERIDGTVAIGLGLTNGISSFQELKFNPEYLDNDLAMTMVVEMKKGKASSVINDIKVLLNNEINIPYVNISGGIRVIIPNESQGGYITCLNVVEKGDFVIISNQDVKKENSKMVKNLTVDDKNLVLALNLPKSHKLMKDFGIKDDVEMVLSASSKDMEMTLDCSVGNSDKNGLINLIIKNGVNVTRSLEECYDNYYRNRYSAEYAYEEDSVEVVEEPVYEEVISVEEYY